MRMAAKANPPSSCSTDEKDGGVVCRSEQGQCLTGGFRGSCGFFSSFCDCGRGSLLWQQHDPADFAGGVVLLVVKNVAAFGSIFTNR